ncbi:hypothetical protein MC885_007225 [Smutsia gigantea]|nr:hypothetical protein MC885_007225 [Smutsia gigantea]
MDLRQVREEAGTTPPEKMDKELGPSTAHKPADGHQWPKRGPHEACWAASQLVDHGYPPAWVAQVLLKASSLLEAITFSNMGVIFNSATFKASSAVFSAVRRLSNQPVTAIFPPPNCAPSCCHGNYSAYGHIPLTRKVFWAFSLPPPPCPAEPLLAPGPSSVLIGCPGR